MKTMLERIDDLKRLWNIVLPHIEAPPENQMARWMIFDSQEIDHAVSRAGRKFIGSINAEDVHRYVTSVLVNERKRKRRGV